MTESHEAPGWSAITQTGDQPHTRTWTCCALL